MVRPPWFAHRHGCQAHRITGRLNSTQICRTSQSTKTRSPPARRAASRIKSFRLPKQAQVSSVSFQAQYQAFVRFAVGSGAALKSHRALLDLRFGTFHSGRALALRTLAFTRSVYGASNPGPTLWRERSRSRGIFQVVFCVPIGLYGGNLPNAAARGIPARSSLGGPWSASPAGAINRQTSSLWPSPNSTTNKPPGTSRRAASGAMAR